MRAETAAVVNTLVQGATGNQIPGGMVSLKNLLDRDTMESITTSAAKKAWAGFVTFGSATAGMIGIFLIIRFIKMVVDTCIHGYTLHDIYGCSFHILGAIWSSITHLLVHLARQNQRNPNETEDTSVARYRRPIMNETNKEINTAVAIIQSQPSASNASQLNQDTVDPTLLQRARDMLI